MDLTNFTLLKGLQDLLNPPGDDPWLESEDEGSERKSCVSEQRHCTGSGHPTDQTKAYINPYQPLPKSQQSSTDDDVGYLTTLHSLPSPEYQIIYKQKVNTEDVFLQIGHKTPSTSSCEDLVIKVHLQDDITESHEMQLEIEERKISLRTKFYLLNLPLPHPINPDHGSAKWDAKTQIFTITLRRELQPSLWRCPNKIIKSSI